MKKKSVLKLVLNLFKFFNKKRKLQIFFIFFLAIFSATAELVTIGSLIPFMDLMIEPARILNYPFLKNIFTTEKVADTKNVMIYMTIIFISLIIFSTLIKISIAYFSISVVHGIGHDLSVNIFRSTIYQPYYFHLRNNTSKTITNLSRAGAAIGTLHLIVQSFVSLIISVSIIFMLLYLDYKLTIIGGSILLFFYLTISLFFKRQLYLNSFKISNNEESRVKNIQESIGGIRETILGNMYKLFLHNFKYIDWTMNKALIKNTTITLIPSHFIMMIAMSSLTLLIFHKSFGDGGIINALPIIAGLILGAQKIIPQLQIVYSGWSKAQGNYKIIDEVLLVLKKLKSNLDIQNSSCKKMSFKNEIKIKSLAFKHHNSKSNIFQNVSMIIKKNQVVGISGDTGCGKSTLLDCIMGLLIPRNGAIQIDSISLNKKNIKNWQKNISHVPQFIYLTDASILENITFGIEKSKIDKNRLIESCKIAEIYKFIKSKKNGFNYIVGERGGRISGGQRQRIGLARALYLNKELLVLDEATNALDEKTEKKIFNNLKQFRKNTTVISITHKKSLIKYFDTHFVFLNNKLKKFK
ncbi:ABC transporter ATP-binding protein/permease [Candidatus Pelagibacter sp.]|nr:ABC transporter ATP-binding protein/permease [Candidatus Pelagibacter sp.]